MSLYSGFTDETGNSGVEMDLRQPWFRTATLLVPSSKAQELGAGIANLAGAVGRELHGSELGVGGLAPIAGQLEALVRRHQCRFIFTNVEKMHLAAMKFADTVMDTGNNRAVAWWDYWVPMQRWYFAHVLEFLLGTKGERQFWLAYRRKDIERFRTVVFGVLARLQTEVRDPRTRELLHDALEWALVHPDEVLAKRSNMDSPNVVSFTLLLGATNSLLERLDARVDHFIYDEQDQFGKCFAESFEMLRVACLSYRSPFLTPEIKAFDRFAPAFAQASGADAPALQLVDVILWLHKRVIENGTTGDAGCDALVEVARSVAEVSVFSRDRLADDVRTAHNELQSRSFTPQQLEKGRRLQELMERDRLARMKSPE
jgi:hypothetical protein